MRIIIAAEPMTGWGEEGMVSTVGGGGSSGNNGAHKPGGWRVS